MLFSISPHETESSPSPYVPVCSHLLTEILAEVKKLAKKALAQNRDDKNSPNLHQLSDEILLQLLQKSGQANAALENSPWIKLLIQSLLLDELQQPTFTFYFKYDEVY